MMRKNNKWNVDVKSAADQRAGGSINDVWLFLLVSSHAIDLSRITVNSLRCYSSRYCNSAEEKQTYF